MRRTLISRILPFAVLLMAAGCATPVRTPASGPGAAAPVEAVERFLQLSAEPDYIGMGWIFGTAEGAVVRRDPPADVERRMYAIAQILQHERYSVRSPAPVPGRVGNAMEVNVALVQRGREYIVPFTVVRGPGQRWFIEQIGLEVITGR